MKTGWSLCVLALGIFALSACATHQSQVFEGQELADSWESQYLDAYGYSGL